MQMRLGVVESSRDIIQRIRQGYQLWCEAKQDEAKFRSARVTFEMDGRINYADAWRYLE